MLHRLGNVCRPFRVLMIALVLAVSGLSAAQAQLAQLRFRVVALAEKGGIHKPFVDAAKIWLPVSKRR